MTKKFLTQFDAQERFFTDSGKREKTEYRGKVDNNGVIVLKPNGTIDLYEYIQSHAESCDINVILAKYAAGDTSVLNKSVGQYMDITDMPTNFAEMYQRVIDAEALFKSLPLDVRAQFGHDPIQFFASIGSEKFEKIFGSEKKPDVKPELKEIKEEENE